MKTKKIIAGIIAALSILMSSALTGQAETATTRTLEANVKNPSTGCVFVGVEGEFISDYQAALKRINEIRQEACKQGYPDPRQKSRKLTMNDYVPIQWSTGLEYITRIRAAEASAYKSHDRPNGYSCFSVSSPYSVWASAEVLAWNFSRSMVAGIEQWYSEKNTWVNGYSGETGHYTAMINPSNKYVGLGCFFSKMGSMSNATCGQFARTDNTGSTPLAPEKDIIQTIEVRQDMLKKAEIVQLTVDTDMWVDQANVPQLQVGDKMRFDFFSRITNGGFVKIMGSNTWSSSDPSVISIDSYGYAKTLKKGKAKISVSSTDGQSASIDFVVKQFLPKPVISTTSAGKKKLTIEVKKGNVYYDGFEIEYSLKKNMSKSQKKLLKNTKSNKVTLKKLKSKKKYYFRIRGCITNPACYLYSDWTKIKSITIK